ncbi:MAG: hypothetical protein GYA24_13370 [Candidatus Lokiarchaeota archaeon]|nr:hypothetical protein [Candidatus Lokiarchaeota archaeon]
MSTIPLDSAGFADVSLFGPLMIFVYLVMISALAIGIGEIACRFLLAPRRP